MTNGHFFPPLIFITQPIEHVTLLSGERIDNDSVQASVHVRRPHTVHILLGGGRYWHFIAHANTMLLYLFKTNGTKPSVLRFSGG